ERAEALAVEPEGRELELAARAPVAGERDQWLDSGRTGGGHPPVRRRDDAPAAVPVPGQQVAGVRDAERRERRVGEHLGVLVADADDRGLRGGGGGEDEECEQG